MKNIQIIDDADNATFSIFQCSAADFNVIFPGRGQDIEVIEDVLGREDATDAQDVLARLWSNPVLKENALGIHGTLFYDSDRRRKYLPASKRERDWSKGAFNEAQRELFQQSQACDDCQ